MFGADKARGLFVHQGLSIRARACSTNYRDAAVALGRSPSRLGPPRHNSDIGHYWSAQGVVWAPAATFGSLDRHTCL